MAKTAADSDGVRVQLVRSPGAHTEVTSAGIPEFLPEAGLSDDHGAYLLQNVAGFCHLQNRVQFVAALGGQDP